MKKILALFLAVLMLISVVACGSKKDDEFKNILLEDNWVLYSMEVMGMVVDYNTINASGYSGTLKFTEDNKFELNLDMGSIINGEGTYECDNEKMTVSMDDGTSVQEAAYADGLLSMEMSEAGITMKFEFTAENGDRVKEAASAMDVPEYDGDIAGTTWSLHSVEADGSVLGEAMFAQFGYSGKITFTNDTYVLDLLGQDMDGEYEVNGSKITLMIEGVEVLEFDRDGGMISLSQDGNTFNFAYNADAN